MRTENFNRQSESMIRRENDGVRRLDEAGRTLQKWWRTDCERFEKRIPMVGDYFW